MPRVLEIGIQTAVSRRGVSVIAHTDKVDEILARQQSFFCTGCCWPLDCTWSSGRGGCNMVLGTHWCSSAPERRKWKWTAATCFFVELCGAGSDSKTQARNSLGLRTLWI